MRDRFAAALTIVSIIVGMVLYLVWAESAYPHTATWNSSYEASPADTDAISQGAGKIRNLKRDLRERMANDHYWSGTSADGQHYTVTFYAPSLADPDPGENKGALYTKDVDDKAELFWEDEDDNVLQITSGGEFDGDAMDIDFTPDNYAPDTSPDEASDVDDLAAHLEGIDDALAVAVREHGCTLSNDTDADHDILVAAGTFVDSTEARLITLSSGITKQIDAAWAAGDDAGGLDTGSVAADTWYHLYVIKGTGSDALFSTSATSPSMPTDYTWFRRVGSVKTDGSANILGFYQYGDTFLWAEMPNEYSDTTVTSAASELATLEAPTGFNVEAIINATGINAAGGARFLIISPDVTVAAISATDTPLCTIQSPSAAVSGSVKIKVMTDTSGRVEYISNSGGNSELRIVTLGWVDHRGRLD